MKHIKFNRGKSQAQKNKEIAYANRNGRVLLEPHGSSDKRIFEKALENFDRPAYSYPRVQRRG